VKIKKLTLLVLACAFLVNQYSYAMQSKVTSVKKAKTVSTRAKRYMALMDEIERELNTGNVVPRNIINDTKEIIKKYTYRYKANLIDIAERALRTGPTTRPIPPTPPTPPIPPTKPTVLIPPTEFVPMPPGLTNAKKRQKRLEAIKKLEEKIEKKRKKDREQWIKNLEKIFETIFGRKISEVLKDLEIKDSKQRKGYRILILNEMEKHAGIYPEKNQKMARNMIANKILDTYNQDEPSRKKRIQLYKTLRRKLPQLGYDIEKIDFLATVKRPKPPKPTIKPLEAYKKYIQKLSFQALQKEYAEITRSRKTATNKKMLRLLTEEIKRRKPKKPLPKPIPLTGLVPLTEAEKQALKRFKARFSRLGNKELLEEARTIYIMKKGVLRRAIIDAFNEEIEKRGFKIEEPAPETRERLPETPRPTHRYVGRPIMPVPQKELTPLDKLVRQENTIRRQMRGYRTRKQRIPASLKQELKQLQDRISKMRRELAKEWMAEKGI